MNSVTLYGAEENLAAFLETEEGGVPEEMREEFALALAGANEAAIDKRDGCIRFVRHVESQIDFAKAEKARINDWQKSLEGGLERFRAYLANVVAIHGKQPKGAAKLAGRTGMLTLRKTPDVAQIVDKAVVPVQYKTVTVTMSASDWEFISGGVEFTGPVDVSVSIAKRPILDALKAGDDVPGAELVFGHDVLVVK